LFTELAENESIQRGKRESRSENAKKAQNKNIIVYEWFLKQYSDFQQLLLSFLSSATYEWAHAVAIRTFLETMKIDSSIYHNSQPMEFFVKETNFPLESYRLLLSTLIETPMELDVDLLVMLKDEVFNHQDCLYFTLYLLQDILTQMKTDLNDLALEKKLLVSSSSSLTDIAIVPETKKPTKGGKKKTTKEENNISNPQQELVEKEKKKIIHYLTKERQLLQKKKNLMDLFRMIFINSEMLSEPTYWISFDEKINENVNDNEEENNSDEDDNDSEKGEFHEGEEEEPEHFSNNKRKTNASSILGKRKPTTNKQSSNKKARITFSTKLKEYKYYQNLFTKNWILLLSFQWTLKEHKILLQHLSNYQLFKEFSNPLLLADYLTSCYSFGGILSILSLEMLLHLIINYNLDYPNFFQSVYALCNVTMMESKYAVKFLSFLSICVKSSNISEVLIFSFVKRLSNIALHISSNRVIYCLKQIIWLLKQYRNSQVLINRSKKSTEEGGDFYLVDEEREMEKNKNHAQTSSLYELELLKNHFLYESVCTVAKTIEDPETTSAGAPPVNMSHYTNITLQSMIDEQMTEMKSNNYEQCALAYKKPLMLFA
jgi:hypothetical protein